MSIPYNQEELVQKATIHLTNLLKHNLELTEDQQVIVIHEAGQGVVLNDILTKAYENALHNLNHKNTKFVLFDKDKVYNNENNPRELSPKRAAELKAELFNCKLKDVAILIQNVNFRISDYRIRLDLKNRGCFVIEHTLIHLEPEEYYNTYIDSLTYDAEHFTKVCNFAIPKIKEAKQITITSQDNSILTYKGPFEDCKTNIGDLKANMGSFYPIGEIFTEPVNLNALNGICQVFAFPDKSFCSFIPEEPFQVTFENGCIISHNGPKEFQDIMDLVSTENPDKKVWVREMGFGLNRHIGKNKPLKFISAMERHQGYHISIGLKHGVYRKKLKRDKEGNKINQRFHIDMFIDLKEIQIDNTTIFKEGQYLTN